MGVFTDKLKLFTRGNCDIIDITAEISKLLVKSGMSYGTLTVFIPGATGAVTTVEYEPGLMHDIKELFEKIIPSTREYCHNAAWQDNNGHSHLRASLVGPSLSVPFCKGKMTLGTWQQIIFIDFDSRPREREIIVQIVGESA